MVVSICVLTMFLSLVALKNNWERNRAIAFFVVFVFTQCLMIIINDIILFGKDPFILALFYNHFTPFFYFTGPFLFFFFRALAEDEIRFRTTDLLHFIPSLITLIGILPYLATPWNYKVSVATSIIQDINQLKLIKANLLIPVPVNNFLRLGFIIFYALWSLKLVIRQQPKLQPIGDTSRQYHYNKTKQWSILVLLIILLSSTCYLIPLSYYLLGSYERFLQDGMPWLWISASIYCLVPITLILYPNVLYGFIQFRGDLITLPKHLLTSDIQASSDDSTIVQGPDFDKKISNQGMVQEVKHDNKELAQLKQAILSYFETAAPYLKSDFKLHDIAIELNVPAHHISYCFSHSFMENFSEVKTRYRIQHAKQLLDQGAIDQFSMEGVGRLSGFASKSNFFTSFKELTGLTPQQYVQQKASTHT
jgi:AraC-like DNA-binding protein